MGVGKQMILAVFMRPGALGAVTEFQFGIRDLRAAADRTAVTRAIGGF